MRIEIIVDEDVTLPIDPQDLRRAAKQAAAYRGYNRGEIGIRVTSDAVIQQINRDHLNHNYPTDVISFSYRADLPNPDEPNVDQPNVEGELVLSADTACQRATELGWSAANETILYVVHGTLHITGMEDKDADQRASMRQAEQTIMMQLGIDDIVRFGADDAGRSLQDPNQSGPSMLEGQA